MSTENAEKEFSWLFLQKDLRISAFFSVRIKGVKFLE